MPVKEGPRAATPDDSRKPDLAGGLGESSSSYPAICVSGATSVAPHIQGGRHIEAIGHLAQRSVRRQADCFRFPHRILFMTGLNSWDMRNRRSKSCRLLKSPVRYKTNHHHAGADARTRAFAAN